MTALGRVAAPPEHESNTATFYFWVDREQAVERTQIVRTCSRVGNRDVKFIGVVQELYRRSRQRDIGEESARFDSRASENPPFASEGVTYAEVAILRTEPPAYCPPLEESEVFLGSPEDAQLGYGVDPNRPDRWLPVGRLRNGGEQFAGTAAIDTDFLLGKNGGHLNVNGIAGLGTKSTLLLSVNWLLLREAARQKKAAPSGSGNPQVVLVIFNVKNVDRVCISRKRSILCRRSEKPESQECKAVHCRMCNNHSTHRERCHEWPTQFSVQTSKRHTDANKLSTFICRVRPNTSETGGFRRNYCGACCI